MCIYSLVQYGIKQFPRFGEHRAEHHLLLAVTSVLTAVSQFCCILAGQIYSCIPANSGFPSRLEYISVLSAQPGLPAFPACMTKNSTDLESSCPGETLPLVVMVLSELTL